MIEVPFRARDLQKKPQNFSINQSIDVSFSQFLSIDPNPDFDWEIAIEELGDPNDSVLYNILRNLSGPITSLID